jgi:hypothetical protein
VVYPLASLLATEQVCLGDVISIDWSASENGLVFMKEAEGALVPMDAPESEPETSAAAAISDGRELSFPAPTAAVAELARDHKVAPPISAQRSAPVEKAKNLKK